MDYTSVGPLWDYDGEAIGDAPNGYRHNLIL